MDNFSFETLNTVGIIGDVISLLLGISLSAACGFRVSRGDNKLKKKDLLYLG